MRHNFIFMMLEYQTVYVQCIILPTQLTLSLISPLSSSLFLFFSLSFSLFFSPLCLFSLCFLCPIYMYIELHIHKTRDVAFLYSRKVCHLIFPLIGKFCWVLLYYIFDDLKFFLLYQLKLHFLFMMICGFSRNITNIGYVFAPKATNFL